MPAGSMKTLIGVIATCALLFNTAYAVTKFTGSDKGGWLGGGDSSDKLLDDDITVKVPQPRLYDLVTYEYRVFGEIYWKNYTSGEWETYQLTIKGQLKRAYSSLQDKTDGFWVSHKTVEYDTDTAATFEIFTDSSGGDPLTIGGSLEAKRKEYIELNTRKPIDAYTSASLEIDRLPKYNVPLSFRGWTESYPDPNRKIDETVDQKLFSAGQSLKKGASGNFTVDKVYEDTYIIGTRYNWSADGVQKVADYKALRLNISADMFGEEIGNTSESFMWFNETVWVTNDCPFPAKRYSLMNQSYIYTDDHGNQQEERYVIETEITLLKGGFTKGTQDIPWGDPEQTVFEKKHPQAVFQSWAEAPPDGDLSSSSFDCGLGEALAEAKKNSSGVQDFYYRFDQPDRKVYIVGAGYNVTYDPTDLNQKVGLYRWNITIGVNPTRAEYAEARAAHTYNFQYSIVIVKNVTKEIDKLRTVYKEKMEIEHDWGLIRGSAPLNREKLDPEGCTLASSEDIMMLYPSMSSKVISSRTNEIDWKESGYGAGAAGLGGGGPGMMLIETLTGMTFPSVDYAWLIQTNTVYQQGETFGAAVDVETGQLVYVLEIQGTALLGLFG